MSVGHSVVVHCDRVGRGSLLGNNCTVLNKVTLGENCLVAANSAVLAGVQIPANSFVAGAPAQVKRPITEKQLSAMRHTSEELVKRAKWFKDSGLRTVRLVQVTALPECVEAYLELLRQDLLIAPAAQIGKFAVVQARSGVFP